MSPALRVALSIAVICAAKKPAWFSSSAERSCTEIFCGSSASQDGLFVRLVIVEGRPVPPDASTAAGISCCTRGVWVTTDLKWL